MGNAELRYRAIGPSRPEDIASAVRFYNELRGDDKTITQWLWEYWTFHADLSVFMVAEKNGAMVGNQATIPIFLNLADRRRLTGKYENALLDPRHRGGDIYTDLSKEAVTLSKSKEMACIWGLTTASRVFRKAGFEIFERIMEQPITVLCAGIALREALCSPRPLLRKAFSFVRIAALASYSASARGLARMCPRTPESKNLTVELSPRSMDDVDALYRRLRSAYPGLIHIDFDAEYLEWRIGKNPNLKSWAFWAYEGSLLRGYCLATLGKGNIAFLSDFTFESDAAGKACLLSALAALRTAKCAFADFFGNRENPLVARSLALLRRFGFVRRGLATFIIMNTSELQPSYIYDIRNWHVNGMWTEGYR